jgi:hypothetical protein
VLSGSTGTNFHIEQVLLPTLPHIGQSADCEFGMFFGENSSFTFCSGPRLTAIALAETGKCNDPRAKIRVTDIRGCSRLG